MFFKKRTNVQRLLSEFRWMWAIQSEWFAHSDIKVLDVGEFDPRLKTGLGINERLWAKLSFSPESPDLGEVRQVVDVTRYRPIGENVALCLQADGKMLDYIVKHEGDDGNLMPFYIYRAAHGVSLHKEVCRYLDSAHRNAVGS